MPAYLRIENPLTFVSRDAAVSYWRKNVDGYAEAVADTVINEYGYDSLPREEIVDVIHRAFNRFAVWTDYERAGTFFYLTFALIYGIIERKKNSEAGKWR